MLGHILLLASTVAVSLAAQNYCFDEYGYVRASNEKWRHPNLKCKRYWCDSGVVREFQTACIWNNHCFRPGRRWKVGCTRMECHKANPFGDITRFSISTELSCEHSGRCFAHGRTWRDGCHKYQCDVKTNDQGEQTATVIPDLGCKWKKVCKRDKDVWGRGCVRYMCHTYFDQYNEPQSKITINAQCRGKRRGECVKLGDKIEFGCHTYKCQVKESTMQLVPIKLACKNKNGECIPEGRKTGDGCTTYQCMRGDNNMVSLTPVKFGCPDNNGGVCIPEGKTWYNKSECVRYTCTKIQKRRFIMQLKTSDHKCPFEGKCKEKGDVWTDSTCTERQCVIKPRGRKMVQKAAVLKQKCTDVYGRCKEWGDTGFKGIIRGVRFDKCACQKVGKRRSKLVCE